MATPHPTAEPSSVSLSVIRRRLIAASPDAEGDPRTNSVDFNAMGGNDQLQRELEQSARGPSSGIHDEVDALLSRYQAEKGGGSQPELDLRSPGSGSAQGLRRAIAAQSPPPSRPTNGSFHGEVLRGSGSPHGLPPLTNKSFGEVERLRTENNELRAMVAELRQFFDENDPAVWEHKALQSEAALTERDELLETQKKQIDEWNEKLKTHRLVPSDHDLAEMSDELEKERCQMAQDRKQLEADRLQLREDEESLMRQMRDMEVSMAKDRADLARQRTEIQRLQGEIRHELDLLQRGDASVKDRLATFQRRSQEAGTRPNQSSTTPLPAPAASPLLAAPPKNAESGVFKRLFGQGNG